MQCKQIYVHSLLAVTFYFLVASENLSVFVPNVKGKIYGEKDNEDNNPMECVSSVHACVFKI